MDRGDGEDAGMFTVSKGKGINRPSLKRLQFELYRHALYGMQLVRLNVPGIMTFNFQPYKVTSDKLALQAFDGNSLTC